MAKTKTSDWLWPKIVDLETATKASRQGMVASMFCAISTVVIALISHFYDNFLGLGMDLSALIDAALFGIIAWGIYKFNRTAAVSGLTLYLIERIFMWLSVGPKNPIMAILLILAFTNSIRGTFAYHKFKEPATADLLTNSD